MATIPGIRRLFRLPDSEARAARDVADEIEFHVEMRTTELCARGVPEADARAQARREFGDPEAAAAELTELARRRARLHRRAELHDWAWRDLRYALRSLRHDPVFSLGVIVTLALGLGANAAMFGMTDRVLLQPPPHVADPGRVVRIYYQARLPWGLGAQTGFSYAEYAQLARTARRFEAVAGYQPTPLAVDHGPGASEAQGLAVTANFFPLLGVEPALGRFFTAAEDAPYSPARVVVLGHGYWRTRYAGSTAVLGRTIEIGGEEYAIIGVAPAGFRGIDLSPVELIVPASAYGATFGQADWPTTGRLSWIQMVGRVRADASAAQAGAEATLAHARYQQAEQYPEPYGDTPDERAVLAPVLSTRGPAYLRGSEENAAHVAALLLAVSLVVLLIACANVANLMLARALRRGRELAIRAALGVSRGRLLSLVVAEAFLLAAAGGALGVLLAWWLGGVLPPLIMPNVDWSGGLLAPRALGFAALLVLLCTVLIGVVPALQAMRTDVATALRTGVREGGGRRTGLRQALVVAQVALSLVLLAGAGLFVKSLANARAIDFGFDAGRVAVVTWNERALDWPPERWAALYERAAERARALPGVEGAALGAFVPGRSNMNLRGLIRETGDTIPELANGGPYLGAVDTAYFRTLGIRVLRGRAFTAADAAHAPGVVIVDEALAGAVWPGADALGKCIRIPGDPTGDTCMTVVGVTENAMRPGVHVEPAPQFYRPLAQAGIASRGLFVRSAGGDARALLPALRDAVQALDGQLPYAEVRTLQSHFDPELRPWRMGVTLFLAFGGLALLVAAVGLYSVMAYAVTMRRHELGVRLVLGARAEQLRLLVLRDAGSVLLAGVLLGIGLAAALTGTLRSLLFGVTPRDPIVLLAVAVVLLAVGGAAAALPARRAARVQPAAVLRED